MNELNINRGFEAMIPRKKQEETKPLFSHSLKFKLFNRRIKILIEAKQGED